MRKLFTFLFTLPALCLLVGCFGFVENDNELSVGFESKLVFKQIGPKDTTEKAKLGIDFPVWMQKPVVDWIYVNQMSPNGEVITELSEEVTNGKDTN